MAKFLFVNQAINYLFRDIISAAIAGGHQVTIMAGTVSGDLPLEVKWIKGVAYRPQSASSRLITWLYFSFQLGLFLICRGHQYDRLLVVSNPPLAPILAFLARRPYALLLYDLYPHVLRDMGHLSNSHWLYRVWQKLNQWTLQRASTVFTLSEGMAKELVMDLPLGSITRQKVEIIPPWSNSQVIYPVPPEANRFMIEAGLTDTFVVLYAGNMGLTHPLETLIEAARHLETSPHIQILMVGDGPKRLALEQQAEGLENLKFLPFLPDPDFNQCLSAASVVVVALQAEAAAASVPSKTYNALAAGKPLLVMAAAEAEISRLVDRYDVGLRVKPNDPIALATAIERMAAHPDYTERLGQRAEQAARNFTPQLAEHLIATWLKDL